MSRWRHPPVIQYEGRLYGLIPREEETTTHWSPKYTLRNIDTPAACGRNTGVMCVEKRIEKVTCKRCRQIAGVPPFEYHTVEFKG